MATKKKKTAHAPALAFEEGKRAGMRIARDLNRLFKKFPLPANETIRATLMVGELEVTVTRYARPMGRGIAVH